MSPRVRPPPPILCLKTHAENATKRAPYEGGPDPHQVLKIDSCGVKIALSRGRSQQADSVPAKFIFKGGLLCRCSSDTVTPCRDI